MEKTGFNQTQTQPLFAHNTILDDLNRSIAENVGIGTGLSTFKQHITCLASSENQVLGPKGELFHLAIFRKSMEMVETFWENHGNYNCLMWKHVEAHLPFLSSHLAPNPRVALCLPTSPQSQRWHSETYGYSGSWPCGCQQNRSAYYIKTYQDCQDSWWKCKEVIYDIYVICTVICSYYDLLCENCEIGRRFGIPKSRQRSIGSKGSNPNNCWTPPFDSETKAAENHKMGHNLPGHPPGIAKHQENISQKKHMKTWPRSIPKYKWGLKWSMSNGFRWFSTFIFGENRLVLTSSHRDLAQSCWPGEQSKCQISSWSVPCQLLDLSKGYQNKTLLRPLLRSSSCFRFLYERYQQDAFKIKYLSTTEIQIWINK